MQTTVAMVTLFHTLHADHCCYGDPILSLVQTWSQSRGTERGPCICPDGHSLEGWGREESHCSPPLVTPTTQRSPPLAILHPWPADRKGSYISLPFLPPILLASSLLIPPPSSSSALSFSSHCTGSSVWLRRGFSSEGFPAVSYYHSKYKQGGLITNALPSLLTMGYRTLEMDYSKYSVTLGHHSVIRLIDTNYR